MKIVVFRYDAGIVTTRSIGYDAYHHSRHGFLCGGSVTKMQKKTSFPPYLGEALRRVLRMACDFPGLGVNQIDHVYFSSQLAKEGCNSHDRGNTAFFKPDRE